MDTADEAHRVHYMLSPSQLQPGQTKVMGKIEKKARCRIAALKFPSHSGQKASPLLPAPAYAIEPRAACSAWVRGSPYSSCTDRPASMMDW